MKKLKLKEIAWDYNMPTDGYWGATTQKDWNETICTTLNRIWATNRPFDRPVKMTIPNKFKSLFENLEYYKQLCTRYEIEFSNIDVDNINVGGTILVIKNFKPEIN